MRRLPLRRSYQFRRRPLKRLAQTVPPTLTATHTLCPYLLT
ncbi:MAG TPA: hypothetical protein V6D35_00700 [Candidatus Sericytochromatia bacterium]